MGDCGTRLIREAQFAGFKGLQGRIPFRMDGALDRNPAGSRERHSRDGSENWRPARGGPCGSAFRLSDRGRFLGVEFHGRAESRSKARDRRRGPDRCAHAQTGWNAGKNPGPGGVVPERAQAGAWERLRAVNQACLGTETSERPGGAQAGRSGVHEHGRHQAPLSSAGRSPGAQTLAPVRGVVKGVVDSGVPLVARQ